jgi:16S rRNA C967 or C1407 C5-methylase (RsmB/RsmF family)
MTEPSKLLLKLSHRLFINDPEQQAAFVEALVHPRPLSSTILWTQPRPEAYPFDPLPPYSWQPNCTDRLPPMVQPGKHPLHSAGTIYCLDTSSVFAASVLQAIPHPVELVVDLCAAPGGKSLLANQILQPKQILCNESIRKRVKILISNLKRCHTKNAVTFNLDPSIFAKNIPNTAQVVIVDAPCSGQSLLAKGKKAEGCFHPVTLKKNAQRQKRILANAAQLVTGGGYLAYMTCTYAPEENEQVLQWFLKKFSEFSAVPVAPLLAYQSPLTATPCYRIWPQNQIGAGAFTTLLTKERSLNRGSTITQTLELQGFIDHFGWLLTI